jgi:hypothetical protein
MAVVELLESTGDGGGSLLGRRSQVTTWFGLSAGEGFGCLWSSPMRAWQLPMAVGDLGRPDDQVWTLSRGLSAAEVRWWAGQCRWGVGGCCMRVTFVLRFPLWIWALAVDVGVPV